MEQQISFTLKQVGEILGFIILCSSFLTLLGTAVHKLRKPNEEQNVKIKNNSEAIAAAEKRLEKLENGTRVTMEALLALLDHGINGNNIEQMEEAKKALNKHLVGKD